MLCINTRLYCARWGNATAALCITRRGGIPAMPALGDVQALLLR